MRTRLTIAGMLSVHAVRAVQIALGALSGVTSADIRLGEALVEHDPDVAESLLREAVTIAGFDVTAVAVERRALPVREARE